MMPFNDTRNLNVGRFGCQVLRNGDRTANIKL
jgi:hypothetical protein